MFLSLRPDRTDVISRGPSALSPDYPTEQVNGFLYDICQPQSTVVQENKVMGYSKIMMCQFYYLQENNKVDRFSSLNSTKSKVFGFQNMFNLLGPNQNFPVWSIGNFPRFTIRRNIFFSNEERRKN